MQALALVKHIQERLCAAGFDTSEARSIARILVCHELGCEMGQLILNREKQVELAQAEPMLQRILAGEPLQYVLGESSFMGLTFYVSPAVLIPRFDSESLVERAIQLLAGCEAPVVADICCGSGCLGLSIAWHVPQSQVLLTDISPDALAVAQRNADLHRVGSRCRFFCGDLAQPLVDEGQRADLVIANPPYIPGRDIAGLAPQVQMEPRLALDGGSDGLELYPRLIAQCRSLLTAGGAVIFEHGDDQQDRVCQLLAEGGFSAMERLFDLAERPRGVAARV